MNKQIVDELKQYSLSDSDIKSVLGLKPLPYNKLNDCFNIDEIFDDKGRCIILYLTDVNSGHWITLLKYPMNGVETIEWYDSYGGDPKNIRKELNVTKEITDGLNEHDGSLVEDLAYKSGYDFIYNKKRRQIMKDGVNSCGDHAIFRSLFYNLNLNEYNKMMDGILKKYKINADDLVTGFIHQYLL